MDNEFSRVVCLNLKRRPDRLENFWREIEKADWPFRWPEVYPALDGQMIPPPKGYGAGSGAWACLESWRRVITDCVIEMEETKNPDFHALFLEDDITLASDFACKVQDFLAEVREYDPGYQGLYLGGQHLQRPVRISPTLVRVTDCNRTHAFSLKGRYLKSAYQMLHGWLDCHIDWRLGKFAAGFPVYAPDPFLIGQDASRSDINGRVNPKKFWNEPKGNEPVIVFHGPREVAEGMWEHGWHVGFERDRKTGIDKGLLKVFSETDPKQLLRGWLKTLGEETASMEGYVTVLFHPLATVEIVKSVYAGPIYLIEANSVEGAIMQDKMRTAKDAKLSEIARQHSALVSKPPKSALPASQGALGMNKLALPSPKRKCGCGGQKS